MYSLIVISIFIIVPIYCNAVYLGEQSNYYKPRLERNNILNKGLWMKDKVEKSNYGDFIFRADSADVDNLLQNFDAFGKNYMDTIPVFSKYVERNKRSAIDKQIQRFENNILKCKDKNNCLKDDDHKQSLVKSKFISQLRPTYVFNDYPYEVAVLLANSNKREINDNEKSDPEIDNRTETKNNLKENSITVYNLNEHNKSEQTNFKQLDEIVTVPYNKTVFNIPKRRMTQSKFDIDGKEKTAFVETNNKTKYIDGNKIHRNVFDKEERIWQNAPIQNVVLPKPESSFKNKPITEKGLVKVLSLLAKTFRKVMKQHNEIQEIDNKLHSLNEDFMKNIAILDTKFKEFDTKYIHLIEMNDEMQRLNDKFSKKNYDIEHRETDMLKNLREFENQQKKFLSQQQKFYTIQKFMLEQNEKIIKKQNLIAKTQSEISHRQNHFARVLKKAKQFYTDKKFLTGSKLNTILNKPKNSSSIKVDDSNNVTLTTPTTPVSTDSVKINLFSIPKIEPLPNHDNLILKEKNYQSVDDLVYKYYFNNTFIDNLMKSKVLTAVVNNEGKNTRNAKNKRNSLPDETTILLPVGNAYDFPISQNVHRERRWIRHPNKISRKFRTSINKKLVKSMKESKIIVKGDKNDPYLTMATSFCIEVGQNQHEQMLNWCVEKSLRKLKSIDMILPMKPLVPPPVENTSENVLPLKAIEVSLVPDTTKLFPFESRTQAAEAIYTANPPVISTPESLKSSLDNALITENAPALFFPDNDELESNLKQYGSKRADERHKWVIGQVRSGRPAYDSHNTAIETRKTVSQIVTRRIVVAKQAELKPDPEGNVYFDGSLHTSDIVISESDALSDIMPGLDSNSHVDVDPLALDLQARRRAYVRRLNENIMKSKHY